MKHAGTQTLDELESLLSAIRKIGVLKEKKRGVFYLKSQAFLHFHEDMTGLFADLRSEGDDWDRLPVNTSRERTQLVQRVSSRLRTLRTNRA